MSHPRLSIQIVSAFLLAWSDLLEADLQGPIVISELMWMGSHASGADEWVELFNCSDESVDLGNWVITRLSGDGDEREMIRLGSDSALQPGEVFLVANYDSGDVRSTLQVRPDVVDRSVSLANSKLRIRLYDSPPEDGGRLVDEADDGRGSPLAGDGVAKHAMVRIDFHGNGSLRDSWETAVESRGFHAGAREFGTPGSIPDRLLPASVGTRPTAISFVSWAEVKSPRNLHPP